MAGRGSDGLFGLQRLAGSRAVAGRADGAGLGPGGSARRPVPRIPRLARLPKGLEGDEAVHFDAGMASAWIVPALYPLEDGVGTSGPWAVVGDRPIAGESVHRQRDLWSSPARPPGLRKLAEFLGVFD